MEIGGENRAIGFWLRFRKDYYKSIRLGLLCIRAYCKRLGAAVTLGPFTVTVGYFMLEGMWSMII